MDLLRILACLGVILMHTAGSPIYHHMVEPGTVQFYESLVPVLLCQWSVPVFAMLTGFFMLDPEKELPLKKLFCKHLARIVVALLFWSLFYAYTFHRPYYPIGSQADHFWYLGMLIGVYLSIPVLRLIATHQAVLKFFCWCWLAWMTYRFLGSFFTMPFSYLEYGVYGEYPGYCLFAYLLKTEYGKSTRISRLIYGLGILGIFLTVFVGIQNQTAHSPFFSNTSPNVIVTSLALFLFFIRNPLKMSGKVALVTEEVSKCTFGVYMIHIWILTQVFTRIYRFVPQTIPLIIICLGMVFVGGLIITWLIRRVPILRNYIV